jgi:hypothetical protein
MQQYFVGRIPTTNPAVNNAFGQLARPYWFVYYLPGKIAVIRSTMSPIVAVGASD